MAIHHGRRNGSNTGQSSGHANGQGQPNAHKWTTEKSPGAATGRPTDGRRKDKHCDRSLAANRTTTSKKRRLQPRPSRTANQVKSSDRQEEVVIVFDVSNLFHTSINVHDGRINLRALMEVAAAGRHVIRAIAYAIESPDSKERPFFRALERCGFELKVRPLQIFQATGDKKGNWDVGIALDAYDLFLEMGIDTVVLVSGDGDFIDLVDKLHTRGGRCEVVSFKESTSHRLIRAADRYIDLSADPEKFVLWDHHGRSKTE